MKIFHSLVIKVLVVVAVVQAWFLYDLYQSNQQLLDSNLAFESKLLSIEKELLSTEKALELATQRIEEMESTSVEGMLEETNKVLTSKWKNFFNIVQDELSKAKEAIPPFLDENTDLEENTDSTTGKNSEKNQKDKSTPNIEKNKDKGVDKSMNNSQEQLVFPLIKGERT